MPAACRQGSPTLRNSLRNDYGPNHGPHRRLVVETVDSSGIDGKSRIVRDLPFVVDARTHIVDIGRHLREVTDHLVREVVTAQVRVGHDDYGSSPERLAIISETAVDLERDTAGPSEVWGSYHHAGRMLLVKDNGLAVLDADGWVGKPLWTKPLGKHPYVDAAQGRYVTCAGLLVDLEGPRLLGRVPGGKALAISSDGRILVPEKSAPGFGAVSTGPLRWARPEPLR
jgi:hypothetical protein